jgi:hypothetical protein
MMRLEKSIRTSNWQSWGMVSNVPVRTACETLLTSYLDV